MYAVAGIMPEDELGDIDRLLESALLDQEIDDRACHMSDGLPAAQGAHIEAAFDSAIRHRQVLAIP